MTVEDALTQVRRHDWARLVGALGRLTGDLAVAEDCVQDAFEKSLVSWKEGDIPREPAAWIRVTARNKAIDYLRKKSKRQETEVPVDEWPAPEPSQRDGLALLFTCAHPALSLEGQIALTLRWALGLDTSVIARAFLTSEETMTRRLTRAKTKVRESAIPLIVPEGELWPQRLDTVLGVVYLLFNHGNDASPREVERASLILEAQELSDQLTRALPQESEVWGLAALLHLTRARRPARFDGEGALVLLERQERALWNKADIAEGQNLLTQALLLGSGIYTVQAAISACHDRAQRAEETEWKEIALWYRRLELLWPTAVVRLNRAVAEGRAYGPQAAFVLLAPLADQLAEYPFFHAAQADFLEQAGQWDAAVLAWGRAISYAPSPSDRVELERRRGLSERHR